MDQPSGVPQRQLWRDMPRRGPPIDPMIGMQMLSGQEIPSIFVPIRQPPVLPPPMSVPPLTDATAVSDQAIAVRACSDVKHIQSRDAEALIRFT